MLYAAEQGQTRCVEVLLDKGANINARDSVGNTALIVSSEHGHTDTVRCLLAKPSCDVNCAGTYGLTALHRAAWHAYNDITALLLQAGANVNMCDQAHETALHVAAQRGNIEVTRLLLQRNDLDVNRRNMFGRSALMRAVEAGQGDVCEMLQQAGANSNLVEDLSCHGNAIHVATVNNHVAILHTLLKAGAELGKRCADGHTELHHAASGGYTDCVRTLLKHGALVNELNRYGDTPLLLAAKNNHPDVVQVLLDHQADVNATCFGRQTALYVAVIRNHVKCARKLLEAGANPNQVADMTSTLLIQAASMGSRAMVDLLLNYDIDVNFMQPSHRTALSYAVENAHDVTMVRRLIAAGAKPDIDVGGRFVFGPLHMACRNGSVVCARALLELGALPDGNSRSGPTPLITAGSSHHMDLVDLLLHAGAKVNVAVRLGNTAWLGGASIVSRDVPITALQYALRTANVPFLIRLVSSPNCDLSNTADWLSPAFSETCLHQWLLEEAGRPKPMKALARWAVLASLSVDRCHFRAIVKYCNLLPLPQSLKAYLTRCCTLLNV